MLTADVFQKIVDAAISLEHKTYHTGGNAALMANKYVSSLIFIIVLMWGLAWLSVGARLCLEELLVTSWDLFYIVMVIQIVLWRIN